eukprot:TRINITY_DN1356_c0_g1_i3.p1 TRINITY_DN1356_c0_g1~~TRINITY_DN1356_c0_g1_i3.p1  ORF type:complete len:345 (-),score=26.30 TRINITY_DN1356_c0_g1_i3:68-1102(-)
MTPFCATSLPLFIVVRVLFGLAQGVTFPTIYYLGGQWLTSNEKSRGMSLVSSGVSIGTICTLGIGSYVLYYWTWPTLFYSIGFMGFLWCLVWYFVASSTPLEYYEHGSVFKMSEVEYDHIVNNQIHDVSDNDSIPWRNIVTHPAVIALISNHCIHNYGFYILLSWLPTYMEKELNFNIKEAGYYSILPYILLFIIANMGGFLSDYLLKRKVELLTIRQIMQSSGLLFQSLFLYLITRNPTIGQSILYFTLSIGLTGLCQSGYACSSLDLSPKYTGIIWGISNTVSTVPGIVGVYLTGRLLDYTGSFSPVFLLTACINIVGTIIWLFFAEATPVDFDYNTERLRL